MTWDLVYDQPNYDGETCVNDDTFGDSGGDTCSAYYFEGNESGCGNYDTDDFISARDCCLCGGGSTGYYEEAAASNYTANTTASNYTANTTASNYTANTTATNYTANTTASNYTALYNYTYHQYGSISGNNLYLIANQTVEQCKAICDADSECMAFEYGMSYYGTEGNYELGDCQP